MPFRPQDKRLVVPAVLLACVLALVVNVFYRVNTVVTVAGSSMEPALQDRDKLLVTRGYTRPRRGDIVVTKNGAGAIGVVKRVIALPGDSVEIVGEIAYVNGVREDFAPRVINGPGDVSLQAGPVTIPPGHVFLLGDNRPMSDDSRHFGPVPLDEVQGKVVAIWAPVYRFHVFDGSGSGS